jgi:DNA-binding winged helix-turn-helix (wHTH) protein
MKNDQDSNVPNSYRYHFGTAAFDEARFELCVAGLPVEVEHRALEVLAYLLRHAGKVVSKTELLREVWAGRITVDKVLPNAIAKLRRALGEANAHLLMTQACVGYRLDGLVERIALDRNSTSKDISGGGNLSVKHQLGRNRSGEVRPPSPGAPSRGPWSRQSAVKRNGHSPTESADKTALPVNLGDEEIQELKIGLKILIAVMSQHQPMMAVDFVKDLRQRAAAANIDYRSGFLGEVIQAAGPDTYAAASSNVVDAYG